MIAPLLFALALAAPSPPGAAASNPSFAFQNPYAAWPGPAGPTPAVLPPRWVLLPSHHSGSNAGNDTGATRDSMIFQPMGAGDEPLLIEASALEENDTWLRAPFGDQLLTDPARWRSEGWEPVRQSVNLDYNRVDQLRVGISTQIQEPYTMLPRVGGRIEVATGRKRTLYGIQIEQPLAPPGRLAIGVSMARRTDHNDLQQVEDFENTLALLFGRQDYRDYFEREGAGVYVSWRVPDFSTVSVHARTDDYRSLQVNRGTRSWFQMDRELRANPAIDDGTRRSAILRLERLAQTTSRTRAGLYHWIEIERAGAGLGGDFEFTRMLADVRSVLRLTPASTLLMRGVIGHTAAGRLPRQQRFPVGGVDGLRAHSFSQYVGDQMLLVQSEYDIGLWKLRSEPIPGGLHALVFVDAGRAWDNPEHRWDVDHQHLAADGGFGIATSDDALRIYFAKNLQELDSDFVISMRLQRPF